MCAVAIMFCWLCLLLLTIAALVAGYYYFRLKYLEPKTIADLSTRNVFVTGCDTGFGRLLVVRLAEQGVTVFAGCLTDWAAVKLEKDCKKLKGAVYGVKCDVSNEESVNASVDFVKKKLGNNGLWALVSNAGIFGSVAPDDWQTLDDYQRCLDVNFLGVVRVVQAFKPLVKKCKGRVVITTSIVSRVVVPPLGPYCVSKYTAGAYSDCLRHELRPFGVSVHILEPSGFKTNLLSVQNITTSMQKNYDRSSKESKTEYGVTFLQKMKQAVTKQVDEMACPDLSLVVDAYNHAVTSKYPRYRYYPGDATIFLFLTAATVPTVVQDALGVLMKYARGETFKPAACS